MTCSIMLVCTMGLSTLYARLQSRKFTLPCVEAPMHCHGTMICSKCTMQHTMPYVSYHLLGHACSFTLSLVDLVRPCVCYTVGKIHSSDDYLALMVHAGSARWCIWVAHDGACGLCDHLGISRVPSSAVCHCGCNRARHKLYAFCTTLHHSDKPALMSIMFSRRL